MRLRVVSEAIGRPVSSVNEVDQTKEFDALKARLMTLAGFLQGAIEDGDSAPGERRRILFVIRQQLRPPRAYLRTILRERFGTDNEEDLPLSELRQLLYTLSARMHALRRGATQPVVSHHTR